MLYEVITRLGGVTCLAGDVIGDWSFDNPLKIGDKLVFGDMAHYTMVKNTTFNGVRLPAIYKFNSETNDLKLVITSYSIHYTKLYDYLKTSKRKRVFYVLV